MTLLNEVREKAKQGGTIVRAAQFTELEQRYVSSSSSSTTSSTSSDRTPQRIGGIS